MSTEQDHDLLAFEVVEQWYASRPGVIANGPSRDRLIAAVRAALDTAAAAARREGIEAAAQVAWDAESGEGDAWERLDGLTERIRALT